MEQYEQSRVDPEQITSAEQFNTSDFFREHLVRTDGGSYEVQGDDLGPVELALLETEKRRRGSQAATSKEKARADKAELEIRKVREIIPTIDISANRIEESLKYSDPDEYIRQTLVAQRANPYDEAFNTASQQAADEVGQKTIADEIATFNADNPNRQITMDMLELDLPPRLINEFTKGQLVPQDFLGQAADIMYRPTETHNENIPVTPNLGEVGGQTTPTNDGSNDQMLETYENAVF